MTEDEALTLEAMKYAASMGYGGMVKDMFAPFTIKSTLAQPAQEPVQRKEWVGLTETEIDEWTPEIHGVIRSIEAKLKEKNT